MRFEKIEKLVNFFCKHFLIIFLQTFFDCVLKNFFDYFFVTNFVYNFANSFAKHKKGKFCTFWGHPRGGDKNEILK